MNKGKWRKEVKEYLDLIGDIDIKMKGLRSSNEVFARSLEQHRKTLDAVLSIVETHTHQLAQLQLNGRQAIDFQGTVGGVLNEFSQALRDIKRTIAERDQVQQHRARADALAGTLRSICLGADNSMTSKEDLGREARSALALHVAKESQETPDA